MHTHLGSGVVIALGAGTLFGDRNIVRIKQIYSPARNKDICKWVGIDEIMLDDERQSQSRKEHMHIIILD